MAPQTPLKRARADDDAERSSIDSTPPKRRAANLSKYATKTYEPPKTPTKPSQKSTPFAVVIPGRDTLGKKRRAVPSVWDGVKKEEDVEVEQVEEEREVEEVELDVTESEDSPSLPTPATTPVKERHDFSPAVTPRKITNIFAHASTLLSTSTTSTAFCGRDEERATLTKFLSARFPQLYASSDDPSTSDAATSSPPPSLYVAGPPGIGKTALLTSVVADFKQRIVESGQDDEIRVVVQNCPSLGSTSFQDSFWQRLGAGLGFVDEGAAKGKVSAKEAFEAGLANAEGHYLIILDEIDFLISASTSSYAARKTLSAKRDLLHTIFSLVHAPNSRLTLIGIANALDLAARSLQLDQLFVSQSPLSSPTKRGSPSKAREGGSPRSPSTGRPQGPQVLSFAPYTHEGLSDIVKARLALLSNSYPLHEAQATTPTSTPLPLMDPRALELCAKKVAKGSGDVRKMLEVVRIAVSSLQHEYVKTELKAQAAQPPSSSTKDTPSAPSSAPSTPTKSTRPSSVSPNSSPRIDLLSPLTPATAPKVTMPKMLLALREAHLTTPPELATKLSELNFSSRMALIGIVVALARTKPPVGFAVELKESVLEADVHKVYDECLRKEGTMQPKNSNDFKTAVDNVECAGGLISTVAAEKAKKVKGGARSGRYIKLSKHTAAELLEGLRSTKSKSCELEGEGKANGVMQETLRISKAILDVEEERLNRAKEKANGAGKDVNAPREGFGGDGLDEGGNWIGERRRI
ncbi:cell division control protein Cdc6 [Pseudohyphozyma bogoriensis]|nr:cell division control protein Cdc6 [Pseudohyphozyma bogoriensis]